MRRSARFLAGIFGHCDSMGQVVDISIDGQPKLMTPTPDEERAYDEYVKQQRQFDKERVAHGLDPVAAVAAASEKPVSGDAGDVDPLSDEDDVLQSVYTEKFADLGLASYMQSILDEKKVEREAEMKDQGRVKPAALGAAQDQPRVGPLQIDFQAGTSHGIHAPAQSMGNVPVQSHRPIPYQSSLNGDGIFSRAGGIAGRNGAPDIKPSPMGQLTNSLSHLDIDKAPSNGHGKTGLAQSHWSAFPQRPEQTSNGAAQGRAKEVKNEEQPLASGSDWW